MARKVLAGAIGKKSVVLRTSADPALHIPEELFVHLLRHFEQIPDPVLFEGFPRTAAPDALPLLYAQDPVADFQRQVDLVQGHQNSAPFPCELLQDLHQFCPVAQVQIGSGLIEDQDRRILRDCSGRKDTLFLSVADRVKIALRELRHLHAGHGLFYDLLIPRLQYAHPSRVGIAACRYHLAAGHILRPDVLRQDNCRLAGSLHRAALSQILPLQHYTAFQQRKLSAYALKERRFSGSVGSDHRQDLTARDL